MNITPKPFEEDAVALVKALSKHYEPGCDHCAKLVEIARKQIATIVADHIARSVSELTVSHRTSL